MKKKQQGIKKQAYLKGLSKQRRMVFSFFDIFSPYRDTQFFKICK